MENRIYNLSPSSFGFLWEECPRCFYDEALGLIKRPRAPFPAIFTTIDKAMKQRFSDGCAHRFGPSQPEFVLESQGQWVRSHPAAESNGIRVAIRGVYDSIIAFDDGTRAVCDFKTSPVKPEFISKYWRQLHAYAYALERPAVGESRRIDRLGLAVFEPSRFDYDSHAAVLSGGLTWIEMPREDQRFDAFLKDVAGLLSQPRAPAPRPACSFCAYHLRDSHAA